MGKVLFYISGHGYGHATRTSEIVRTLSTLRPDTEIHVRTAAPAHFFRNLEGNIQIHNAYIDVGVAETDGGLTIDPAASIDRLRDLFNSKQRIVAEEVAFVTEHKISVVVTDIPFFAGNVSRLTGACCVAVGNWTWDWIYEPFAKHAIGLRDILDDIRSSYREMDLLLRLPFSNTTVEFKEVIDVPLLTRTAVPSPEVIRKRIGLNASDNRTLVLWGMRDNSIPGGLNAATLRDNDLILLCPGPPPRLLLDGEYSTLSASTLSFVEMLRACDVVIAKLGYSTIAECIANDTAMVFPPRVGFREDDVTRSQMSAYIRACELPLDALRSNQWVSYLRAATRLPSPTQTLDTDGASICASVIASRC